MKGINLPQRHPRLVFLLLALLLPRGGAAQDLPAQRDGLGSSAIEVSDTPVRRGEARAAAVLKVDSIPKYAEVRLNFTSVGTTPLELPDLAPGLYRLSLSRAGYHDYSREIEVKAGKTTVVTVNLGRLLGRLSLRTEPGTALVLVDGLEARERDLELSEGSHSLTFRAFGYEDHSETVEITALETRVVEVQLRPAAFEVRDLSLSRASFSPRNPGQTGTTRLSFVVTGPGRGLIEVLDNDGAVLRSHGLEPFTDWAQQWTWDGRDQEGAIVPDGTYRMVLRAESGGTVHTREAEVRVDSSLMIRYSDLLSGTGGLALVPDTEVLPPGNFQLSSLFLGRLVHEGVFGSSPLFPVAAGLRLGLGLGMDVTALGLLAVRTGELAADTSGSLSLRYSSAVSQDSGLALGAVLGLHLATAQAESPVQGFRGVRLALLGSLSASSLRFLLAPALDIEVLPDPEREDRLNGRLRAGLGLGGAELTGGVSAELELRPWSTNPALPLRLAAEVHLLPRGFPLYLTVLGMTVFTEGFKVDGLAGLGLGLVY